MDKIAEKQNKIFSKKKFFVSNKIFMGTETVAEQLRSARQNRKIKLKQVAEKLKINYKYLDALEKGDYNKLPKGIYGKNFLREYANFLKLNYLDLIAAYELEANIYHPREEKELFAKQVIKNRYFWAMPKVIKNILIIFIVIVCFVYLGFRLNRIIALPNLLIISPADNLVTKQRIIEVSGQAEPETKITINGETILNNIQGNFNKTINLKIGLNFITITASKKYGKNRTITKQVLVNPVVE